MGTGASIVGEQVGPAARCVIGAEELLALSSEIREHVQERVGELVGHPDPEDKKDKEGEARPTPSSLLGRIEDYHKVISANLRTIREEIVRL